MGQTKDRVLDMVERIARSIRESGERMEEMASAIEIWTEGVVRGEEGEGEAMERMVEARARTVRAMGVIADTIVELNKMAAVMEGARRRENGSN